MNLQLFFRKLIKFENVRWIFNKRALGKARNNTPFPKALYCYPDKIIIPNSPPNSLSLHGISPFYIAGLPPICTNFRKIDKVAVWGFYVFQ